MPICLQRHPPIIVKKSLKISRQAVTPELEVFTYYLDLVGLGHEIRGRKIRR